MVKNSSDREARNRLRTYQARTQLHEEQVRRRRRDNLWGSVAAVVIVLIAVGAQLAYFGAGPGSLPAPSPSAASGNTGPVPSLELAEGRDWTGSATIGGVPVTFTLNGAVAPQAVASTFSLANSGFYAENPCHRLTTANIFVLQCGAPGGDPNGNAGYSYGPIENAPADNFYPAGTIAIARAANNAWSQGSQFFIVYQDSTIPSDTAGGYTVIGRLTSGLDQLQQLVAATGVAGGATDGQPASPIVVSNLTIQ